MQKCHLVKCLYDCTYFQNSTDKLSKQIHISSHSVALRYIIAFDLVSSQPTFAVLFTMLFDNK